MRTLLLTIALFVFSAPLFAQYDDISDTSDRMIINADANSFLFDNTQVVWQRVYNVSEDANVNSLLAELDNVVLTDKTINGKINSDYFDYQAQGYKRLDMPIFLSWAYNATVTIEKKPGRYRVTVEHIEIESMNTASRQTVDRVFYPFEETLFKRNGEMRMNSGIKIALKVMDADFADKFTIKKTDNDW